MIRRRNNRRQPSLCRLHLRNMYQRSRVSSQLGIHRCHKHLHYMQNHRLDKNRLLFRKPLEFQLSNSQQHSKHPLALHRKGRKYMKQNRLGMFHQSLSMQQQYHRYNLYQHSKRRMDHHRRQELTYQVSVNLNQQGQAMNPGCYQLSQTMKDLMNDRSSRLSRLDNTMNHSRVVQ